MQDVTLKEPTRTLLEDRVTLCLSAVLLPVVFGLYLSLGYMEGLVYWSFWFVMSVLMAKLAQRLLSTPLSLVRFGILSYLVLTIMGLMLVLIYRSLYNADFAPWGDDSYYFGNILRVAGGEITPNATLYEYIVSVWYLAVEMTKPEPVLLDILPMNWAIGAMIMVLSYALSYEVTKFRCSLFLASVTLLGNCTLANTVVNLYRDGMVIMFSLVVMLAVARSKILIALVGTVLAIGVRGANGMLMALFIVYAWTSKSQAVARNWVLTSILLAIITGAGLFLDHTFGLGSRLRNITGATSASQESESVGARAMKRAQWLIADETKVERSRDMMRAFANKVPGGLIAMPVLTMFAPARFPDIIRRDMECSFALPSGRRKTVTVSGIFPMAPLNCITVLSWVIVAPYLVLGLVAAFRGTSEERKFLIFFVLALLSITYVSLLARHRLIFIVLYPVFVALGSKVAPKQPGAMIAMRIITIGVIAIANLVTYIM